MIIIVDHIVLLRMWTSEKLVQRPVFIVYLGGPRGRVGKVAVFQHS